MIAAIDEDGVGEGEGRSEQGVPADLGLRDADEVAPQQRAEQERIGAALVIEDEDRRPQREMFATDDGEPHAGCARAEVTPDCDRAVDRAAAIPRRGQRRDAGAEARHDRGDRSDRAQ